jgi:hypothetical protein
MVADRDIGLRRGPACDLLDAIETERQNDHEGRCVGDGEKDPGPDCTLPSALGEIPYYTAEEE